MLDLDQWPNGTDKILVYLLEQEQKGDDSEGWGRRGRIARVTGLNEEQVRYRVEELEESGHLIKDYVDMVDQTFAVYSLRGESRKTAEAIQECTDILGEVPEEPTRDDILHLTWEISSIRNDYDFTNDGDPMPEYVVEMQEHVDEIDELGSEIERLEDKIEENHNDVHNRIETTIKQLNESLSNIFNRLNDLEEHTEEGD